MGHVLVGVVDFEILGPYTLSVTFDAVLSRRSSSRLFWSQLNHSRIWNRPAILRARPGQVRTGLAQTASNGRRWVHCRLTSRAGMAGAVSRWLGAVEDLPNIAMRLMRVQIEHDLAANVIARYDSEETLFYCDPPYPHELRGDSKAYRYELTDEQHVELARVLHTVKGKVALSGYHCALLDNLYADWNVCGS